MALLPQGFALPPLPYLVLILVGLAVVAGAFYRRQPTVTEHRIVALAPWMVVGSVIHALYVLDALPGLIAPLAGTPAVYLSVAVLAGGTWLAADSLTADVTRTIAIVGGLALTGSIVAAGAVGMARPGGAIGLAIGATVLAFLLAAVVWYALIRSVPAAGVTGTVGMLAVFAHALDGVSTAVAVDLLGYGERTPLSRLIIEFAAGLPTDPYLGAGWLFVLVKVVLACVIVVFFADYVEEDPQEGYLLLGFVAAVGLGPGAHNLVLFAVA